MIEEFLKQLESEDSSARRDAAAKLGATDARAIYPLIKALWDESPGVQETAVNSLSSFADEATVWAVLPLLREDAPRRNMAIDILTSIGPKVVPFMAKMLIDKDPDVRKFLADVFGVVGGDQVVPPLMKALSDKNANVRASAAKSLGMLGIKEAVPHLVKLLEDDEWVAFGAVEALGNIADEEAVHAITSLLDGPSLALRIMAIEALGDISSPLATNSLFKTLEKVDDEEKMLVAKSLVRIGITNTVGLESVLMNLLKNGEPEDRIIAVQGLTDLRCNKSVPLMIELAGAQDISIPDEEELYRVLMNAIVNIGDEAGLARLLGKNKKLKYRAKVAVIDALGHLQSRIALQPLLNCLKSPQREVRRAAARAQASIAENSSATSLMDNGLTDEDGHVRRSAARALGRIGEKKALPILLEIIRKETYPDVLEDVIEAAVSLDESVLGHLAKSKQSNIRHVIARLARGKELLPLVRDKDENVRTAAVLSLGQDEDPKAGETLAKLITDPDVEVRKAAVRGLGRIGDKDCRKALIKCLSDKDMWVKMFAIDALADLDEASAVSDVRKLLAVRENGPVRIAAVRYLARLGAKKDLEKYLKDADPLVRDEAACAIEQMDTEGAN